IKAIGCAALRDGVYLLPARAEHAAQLNELADETLQENGQAWVLRVQAADAAEDAAYRALFDRTPDYAEWLAELSEAR
ncbi:Chromate resistance protein ChrB, partial [Escherichia coli]|uniref:Chromate resistance protein ChrB n=2 Tax=Pseudomonadota TaxID=1224 RepID=UPI003217FC76